MPPSNSILNDRSQNPKQVSKFEDLDDFENFASLNNEQEEAIVQVKKSTILHYNKDEDYKMLARPRGVCLIINNVDFDNELLASRKGSDRDAHRFKHIFRQFGFDVTLKRNLNAEKMRNILRLTATSCKSQHDAAIIILLSHGTETGVYGTDAIEVDMNQTVSYFDNKHCKQLIGKPKVFIVQACRGRIIDYGVGETQTFFSQPESQSVSVFGSQDSVFNSSRVARWNVLDKHNQPTRTDMMLCFSCLSGHISNRNEEAGSWLGIALASHLQNYAHEKHLMDILNMVSRDVRKQTSADGIKQALEVTCIGFDRNLFFNPGLYADSNQ